MRLEKVVTRLVPVETYCQPMFWAIDQTKSDRPDNEYVIAQFNSEHDAKFFVEKLPPQGLEVRRIVEL